MFVAHDYVFRRLGSDDGCASFVGVRRNSVGPVYIPIVCRDFLVVIY